MVATLLYDFTPGMGDEDAFNYPPYLQRPSLFHTYRNLFSFSPRWAYLYCLYCRPIWVSRDYEGRAGSTIGEVSGSGRGLWHPHTPRKLRLGNRLYDLCAFGARLSHFPFKFTALGHKRRGGGVVIPLKGGAAAPPPPPPESATGVILPKVIGNCAVFSVFFYLNEFSKVIL